MYFPVLVGACWLLCGAPALAQEPVDEPLVLVLNSYHPQYKWTARLVEGVQEELRGHVAEEQLRIEYMDGRHLVDDPDYQQQLNELYRLKYADFKPSVIISSDDYAFNYLLEHRDTVFPGTPVVFCGVNVFDPEMLEGHRGYTGILEGMEIAGNIELITSVHPDVQRIIMLADRTSLGERMGKRAHEVMEAHAKGPTADRVKLELWDDFALPQLYEDVGALDKHTVLLLLAIHKDSAGNYFSFSEELPILSERSAVPIYGMWGALLLGQGVLGGKLNAPYLHGKNTAAIAKRILAGEDPDDIPIAPKAVYLPAFDYEQMERFGLSESALPAAADVQGRPVTFYSQYRALVWGTLISVFFLVAVIVTLLLNTARRKRAEGALGASEQKLSLHVQSSSLGFIEWSQDLTVTSWNPAATQIFGYSESEAIGRHISMLFPDIPEEDSGRHLNALGRQSRASAENQRKDGERVQCVWFHTPLVSAVGDVIGLASLVEDVTERSKLEEQLLQSQKMEAVGLLAGGIAHDFNNILTGILGNLELASMYIEAARSPPEVLERLAGVRECGMLATKLVRQLLVFSRKDVAHAEVLDTQTVLQDTHSMLTRLLSENISMTIEVSESPLRVRGDRSQLEQILMNLVINAADAMPEGGELVLRTEGLVADGTPGQGPSQGLRGDSVRLSVIDTGTGMSEQTIKRACEPFFTTKPVGKGTGLGLSTVFGLVSKWGGQLHIDSVLGQGTTVAIDLPLSEDEVAPEAAERDDAERGGTETILVCEDDPQIRSVLSQVLGMAGYQVTAAADGVQAQTLAGQRGEPFELLLTDVIMPKMSGWELSQQLQAKMPSLKTLFISGYTDDVLSQNLGQHEFTLLRKPFERAELLDRVREVLDG